MTKYLGYRSNMDLMPRLHCVHSSDTALRMTGLQPDTTVPPATG